MCFSVRRFFWSLISLFIIWLLGLGIFLYQIPRQIIDEETKTQAIVVLTGGRHRLKTGFDLLSSEHAPRLFISGVHPEETLKSLLRNSGTSGHVNAHNKEQLLSSIDLGYTAQNTQENAAEVQTWLHEKSIRSFRLVTANYHMPRSLLEFKHKLPHVMIVPHPVFPQGIHMFYGKKKSIMPLVLSEYHKFLVAFVRIYCLPEKYLKP